MARPGLLHTRALAMALLLLDTDRLEEWGRHLALRLPAGARLLVAGNGGSAAQAQHLTSELVGRFDAERIPLSAIALHADSSTVTAIVNDYGAREVFARQIHAHGRPGDVLLLISTSGRSPNVLAAAAAGRELELTTWALTGTGPNPLVQACQSAVCVDTGSVATVQECHLVAVHVLCAAIDAELAARAVVPGGRGAAETTPVRDAAAGREPEESVRRLVIVGDVLLDRDISGPPNGFPRKHPYRSSPGPARSSGRAVPDSRPSWPLRSQAGECH